MEQAEKEDFHLVAGSAAVAGCKRSLIAAEEPGRRARDERKSKRTEGPAEASVPDWGLGCCHYYFLRQLNPPFDRLLPVAAVADVSEAASVAAFGLSDHVFFASISENQCIKFSKTNNKEWVVILLTKS